MPSKPKRRIMRTFKIDEISAVGMPAQQGAKLTLMKSKDAPTGDDYKPVDVIRLLETLQKNQNDGDNTMSESIKDLQKKLEEQAAKTARFESIIVLTPDHRAYFDGLNAKKQDAFLAKSEDERSSEIEAVQKATTDDDPVVYTTMDGMDIRKSAGEAVVVALKASDEIRKENAVLKGQREQDRLEKAASETLSNLPGDLAVRASVLKAVEGIENEEHRDGAMELLKAGNEAIKAAFETVGVRGQPKAGSPDDRMEKMVKDYAKEHKVTEAEATLALAKTAEYRELYAQSVSH